MKDIKIGVVLGGPSAEREVSVNTGQAIVKALQEKNYTVVAIDLDPHRFVEQIRQSDVDVVFNAIHGKYGEDGVLQGTLDMLQIPYTGSGLLACSLTMDKVMSKRVFWAANLPTPRYCIYCAEDSSEDIVKNIINDFGFPVVIKPASQGSSIGVTIVKNVDQLQPALQDAFAYDNNVLVEEFIAGKEVTVAVLGGKDGTQALPIIEIRPHSGNYDYHSKYTKGATDYIVPAPISGQKTAEIQEIAVKAFRLFGCRGVARIDFMLDSEENPYVLEINTVPGMTATSLVPKAAAAAGLNFPDLCEKLLGMVSR